jgi:hypothetical protein
MTAISRLAAVGFVAVSAGLLLPAPGAAQTTTREGFYFGIGGGAGSAAVSCDTCESDADRELGGSGYVKAGWTLNPHVLAGGELNVWTRKKDFEGADAWFTIYNVSATITLYPSATGGFFVKGGGGVAYVDTDVQRRGSRVTLDLGSGPGVLAGAGYDLRVGRWAVTPAVNYWFGRIGDRHSRGDTIASGWRQHVVDVTLGVTVP